MVVLLFILMIAAFVYSTYANPKWKTYKNSEKYCGGFLRGVLGIIGWIAIILLFVGYVQEVFYAMTVIAIIITAVILAICGLKIAKDGFRPMYPCFLLFMASLGVWSRIILAWTLIGIPLNRIMTEWAEGGSDFFDELNPELAKARDRKLEHIKELENKIYTSNTENKTYNNESVTDSRPFDNGKYIVNPEIQEHFRQFMNKAPKNYNREADEKYYIDPVLAMGKTSEEILVSLRKGYELGGALCAQELGKKYLQGDGVVKDIKKAEKCLTYAADCGMPGAMSFLAISFDNFERVTPAAAMDWLCKAAIKGDALACRALEKNSTNPEFKMQIEARLSVWFQQSCIEAEKNHHAKSKFFLGWCYYTGICCRKDKAKAVQLIDEASEKWSGSQIGVAIKSGMYDRL